MSSSRTPVKVTWINGKAYVPNPAYDNEDPDTQFMPKMVQISKEKALRPGGHFEYSSKVYFFAPIGANHVNLSPEARARLSKANFEFDDEGKPIDPAKAKLKAAQVKVTKSWIETHVFGGLQRLANDPAALNGGLTTWIPRMLFLLLPLYAALLALFYIRKRKQFFYVDHLIFSLTIHTFGFVLLMLAAGAAQFLSANAVAWGTLVIGGIYALIATRNFYHQNWFWTVVKFASVSFVYVCFFVFPRSAW